MLIIVDQNEQATNPQVVDNLKLNFKQLMIANLNAGDINIPLDDGSVLAIERKTPTDLLRSVRDGEMFNQIERMSQFAKYSAVIVTGYIGLDQEYITIDDKDTDWQGKEFSWKSSSIDNLFTVIQWSGCALKFCSPDFYCQEIERLYQVANKPSERQGLHKRRIVTFPPIDPRVEALALLPGIGLKRAESLMKFAHRPLFDDDEYGSLSYAFELASTMVMLDKDLRPDDWGPKTILNFRKFLGLQSNEYLCVKEDNNDNQKTTNQEE